MHHVVIIKFLYGVSLGTCVGLSLSPLFSASWRFELRPYLDANWSGDSTTKKSTKRVIVYSLVTCIEIMHLHWQFECYKIAYNPVFQERTKHLEIKAHFVRQYYLARRVWRPHVPSADKLADFFMKAHPVLWFKLLVHKLNLIDSSWVWGGCWCVVYR